MADSTELAITSDDMGAIEVKHQVQQIQYLMKEVLKEGTHYGKVPGCGDKPTLLQPGAEKINLMFGLVPSYTIDKDELPGGHREYTITCTLSSRKTGELAGEGVGLCSTMESKYRYRNVADYEVTGDPIPADSKERKQEYRRQGYGMKKVDGAWEWVHYLDAQKSENPDIADVYNTVLKMAKKRALVDATKSTTAASDIFTQDLEDLPPAQNYSPQPTPVVDLTPVRSRFKAWCSAVSVTPKAGTERICARYGASDMAGLTQAQVEDAAKTMDAEMAEATAPAEVPADVDPETGEVTEPELYPEDVEF